MFGNPIVLVASLLILGAVPGSVDGGDSPAAAAPAVFQWTLPGDPSWHDGRYRDLKYDTRQWYGSTFFTGPDWTRVGKDWHHPGQNTPSVRCFVVPHEGSVHVSGQVLKLHRSGDGICAVIRLNDRQIWSAEIDGADGVGTTHDLRVDVQEGDRLRFIVDRRGSISCDTTGWDPSTQFAGESNIYRASDAFDRHQQGAGGWRYEMEVGGGQREGMPVVYAWSRDFAFQLVALQPGKTVTLTDRDALPLIVVADGNDQGGFALAGACTGSWVFTANLDRRGMRRSHGGCRRAKTRTRQRRFGMRRIVAPG